MLQRNARSFDFSRSVSARLVERFIFNFRMSPNSLDEKLRPIPSVFGFETTCCAYRCGVVEYSDGVCSPSVYILGRNNDSRFLSLMAPVIFESSMPSVEAIIEHLPAYSQISVRFEDGRPLFSARVFPSKSIRVLESKAVDSLQDFVKFIKDGVSSYAKSTRMGQYSRIDLYKDDEGYESMDAEIRYSHLDHVWNTSGLEYDSVVRAGSGGLYVWTFRGKVPARLQGPSTEELTA